MQIFIHHDGQQLGPYSLEETKAYLADGSLSSNDLAWYEGAPDWVPLASVPGVAQPKLSLAARASSPSPSIETSENVPAPVPAPVAAPTGVKKLGILLALVFTILATFICALVTLTMVAFCFSEPGIGVILATILSAIVTVGVIWLMAYLNKLRGPTSREVPVVCQCCFRPKPIIKVSLNRHIGLIVVGIHKSVDGYLCKDCINRTFWEFTPTTLILGWWGIISFFTTPVVLLNNLIGYIRSKRL